MFNRQFLIKGVLPTVVITAVAIGIFAVARQGEGGRALAQAPLNVEVQIPPAFIMAVDNSGSMNFHNQFPAADGYACWTSAGSFFSSTQVVSTSGSCRFAYAYTGPRNGERGVPPLDSNGFARSPDFNPAYFDPTVTYEPWLTSAGTPYGATLSNPSGNASVTQTLIDPRGVDTIRLAAWLEDASDRSRFNFMGRMFLPQGTRYDLVGNGSCGNLSGGGWQTVGSGGITVSQECETYVGYWPATFYLRSEEIPAGYEAVERTPIANACGTGCWLYRYRIQQKDTAALQNFANWFSFYGNRNRAMIAGLTRSMADVKSMRVGYFTINGSYNNVAMRDMGSAPDKELLFNSMLALNASGGTPNLPAVNHMGAQFKRTDAGAPVRLACQKNGGMLFTDGLSNSGSTADAVTGKGAPFDPTPANSMAAIASQFYFDVAGKSPIRDDLPGGQVPVPDQCSSLNPSSVEWKRLDCQPNLHMNFYGVTLGARGNIYDPDSPQDPFVTNPAWPGYQSGARSTVDDIWHAAVNTRGEFINAKTPAEITEAMRRILIAVGAGSTTSGSLAITGSRIGEGSLSVTPFYESKNNGTDWYSKLTAQSVASNPVTGVLTNTNIWEASANIPAAASRNIWVRRAGVVSAFNSSNVQNLSLLCSNTTNSQSLCTEASITNRLGVNINQAISYLRGNAALEATTLRTRTTRLGDIVNSTPVVSTPTDDYGYRSLVSAGGVADPYGYGAYLDAKKAPGRTSFVYVGANDGMLHAFRGTDGVEAFAYIPSTALGHMGNLLFPYNPDDRNDQVFRHRYYVDGPVTVSDAYYGGSWKTVLVGTSGAGGRSVFGMNISNPASFSAASSLWELVGTNSGTDPVGLNLGSVLGRPVVVPVMQAGAVSWKAIFGNGYGSRSGVASLFVVDMQTGVAQILQAKESGAVGALPNGLGNIVAVDRFTGSTNTRTPDGYADTVYAADQNGAVWKFDLRTATSSVTPQANPFFIAQDGSGNRQAVIGGLAAARGASGGVMVYFGSGAFSFEEDGNDDSLQTFYGVSDDESGASVSRSDLLQQRVLANIQEGTGGNIIGRTVTNNPMVAGRKGWYIDLGVSSGASVVRTGERFVGYPTIENGIVFFATYEPTIVAGCTTTGANRLYGLNSLSGAAALSQVRMGSPTGTSPGSSTGAVGLSTDGTAPVKDVAVLSTPRLGPLPADASATDQAAALAAQCSMVVQVAGASPLYLPRACGRQSWRQIR